MRASTLSRKIAELTLTRKAGEVIIMDLRKLTSVTDFFVICSADSDVQIKAIADAVEDGLLPKGISPWHREAGSPNWVLLDYVDVVLHIFHKDTRPYYNLEKLWGDATIDRIGEKKPRPRVPTGKRKTRKAPVRKRKTT